MIVTGITGDIDLVTHLYLNNFLNKVLKKEIMGISLSALYIIRNTVYVKKMSVSYMLGDDDEK